MRDSFESLVKTITQSIAGRPVDAALEAYLNRQHGPGSDWFRDMTRACEAGVDEGWLCNREAGGVRYGRVVKPGPGSAGFSVDVVDMTDLAGPHHVHPNGEIDMVMPQTAGARFDGTPAGWKVYPPGSAHRPTVAGGRALVLYLLPDGAIEFTRS
ncbi:MULTISPECIES: DUF4863 family protein [unclassified Pigmentiphaga]|uniref:4-hydroxylaminobenzoate lyase n=1 Tax=unclassified Pigmentiphaga TaxID=2626614 RepID=UPI000B411BB9|nr:MULTISPECIES: DUF4863 family protein [unclassified Pigmentiphaga]OVZ58622.1 DUF4863 domain-containing protein [Pigmentiphaga sp. NML030171]